LKLFVNIDKAFKEARVTIESPNLDENIKELIDFIHEREHPFIIGRKGEMQRNAAYSKTS